MTIVTFLSSSAYADDATESPDSASPFIPKPPGGDIYSELYGTRPYVKNNTDVMNFIDTHGISSWYERSGSDNSRYLYLLPADNYSKRLVVCLNWVAPYSIRWVRQIGLNEEIPDVTEKPIVTETPNVTGPMRTIDDPHHISTDIFNNISMIFTNISMEFFGAHPNVKNNTTVSSFIDAYGISNWSNEWADADDHQYQYVYVQPAENYSKQLVILYYLPDDTANATDDTGTDNSVIWARQIDKGKTLALSSEAPGFTPGVALASIGLLLLIVRLKKK